MNRRHFLGQCVAAAVGGFGLLGFSSARASTGYQIVIPAPVVTAAPISSPPPTNTTPPTPAMPGYRYWRIYVTATNGDAYLAIQEMEMATSPGGANVASNGMPTWQSSSYGGGDPFAAAFNGSFLSSPGCLWLTDGKPMPQWGSIDLGSQVVLQEVRMQCQNWGGGPGRAPKNFVIQGSNDNSTWTDVRAFAGVSSWAVGKWLACNLLDGSFA